LYLSSPSLEPVESTTKVFVAYHSIKGTRHNIGHGSAIGGMKETMFLRFQLLHLCFGWVSSFSHNLTCVFGIVGKVHHDSDGYPSP
jgi:hypothetical protein